MERSWTDRTLQEFDSTGHDDEDGGGDSIHDVRDTIEAEGEKIAQAWYTLRAEWRRDMVQLFAPSVLHYGYHFSFDTRAEVVTFFNRKRFSWKRALALFGYTYNGRHRKYKFTAVSSQFLDEYYPDLMVDTLNSLDVSGAIDDADSVVKLLHPDVFACLYLTQHEYPKRRKVENARLSRLMNKEAGLGPLTVNRLTLVKQKRKQRSPEEILEDLQRIKRQREELEMANSGRLAQTEADELAELDATGF